MKRKIKQQTTRQISYYTVSIHSHFYTYMSTFWLSLVGLRTSIAELLLGIHNVCELFFSLYVLVLLLLFCSVLLSRVIVFFSGSFFHAHATLKLIVVIVVVLRCGLLDWLANIFLFILRSIAFWCQMFASCLCWDLVQFYSLLSSR